MIRVSIDDQVSLYYLKADKKLREILEQLVVRLPADRIISNILFNGRPLTRQEENRALDSQSEWVDDLEIRTADVQVWAVTGLDMAIDRVESIQRSLLTGIEICKSNESLDSLRYLTRCIESIERFIETIVITRSVRRLNFDLWKCTDGRSLNELQQSLESMMREIHELKENGEFDQCAERMEYELLPNLSAWYQGLRKMREELDPQS